MCIGVQIMQEDRIVSVTIGEDQYCPIPFLFFWLISQHTLVLIPHFPSDGAVRYKRLTVLFHK